MVVTCPEDEIMGRSCLEVEELWQKQDDCFRQIRQIELKMERCNGDIYQQKKFAFHLSRLRKVALPRINQKIGRFPAMM